MSRQTDKEEREAEEKAKAKEEAKANAKAAEREAAEREAEKKKAKANEPVDEAAVPSQLQPYPQGNPPDPEDTFEKMHGFRRVPPEPAKEK